MGFNLNYLSHHQVAFFLLISLLKVNTTLAVKNVFIDDQDSSITYSPPGEWEITKHTTLDYGGTHKLTSNPNATASFNFTGIAIYFLSPLWPYTVNTAISLDSGPITLVDLVDHSRPDAGGGPETIPYDVVWSATGLVNTQHNLRISVGAGQLYAVVDGLIYTDATDVTSSLSSSIPPSSSISPSSSLSSTSTLQDPIITSSTANATPTPSVKSKSHLIVGVALGSFFGILSLFAILCAAWYIFRRRKRPISEARIDGALYTTLSRNPSMSAVVPNATNNENWTVEQLYPNGSSLPHYNDGKAWYNQGYEKVVILAPPIPSPPYYRGGYCQIDTSSPRSAIHQPQITGETLDRYQPGCAL
ncbi:hypothetical protein BYT27DRAFT_7339295 [Phlegmacium glaucopus]|nr:hypothetical protein BYT27DRAFT_7339295 [Phlegmacium glaucopus]